MASPTVDPTASRAAWFGAVAIACIVAAQVAAKTVRDALFLSSWPIERLPAVLLLTAVTAILTSMLFTWMQKRWSPCRVVPVSLAAAALVPLALAGLLAMSWISPGSASVVLYLHTGALGAVLISGFWSTVNERLDPHSARKLMARMGAGGTIGGLAGGLLALAFDQWAGYRAPLLLLSIFLLVAAFADARLAGMQALPRTVSLGPSAASRFGSVIRVPHLRELALLILLTTMATGLVDYVMKARADAAMADRASLMTYFAFFYTGMSLLSVLLQVGLARRLLERFGLAQTAAVLPATLGIGGVVAALVPGLGSALGARVAEGATRSSLFRSAYEPMYTPLPTDNKRATKSLIDVGVERGADGLAAVIVQCFLWFSPVATLSWIAGLGGFLGLVALMRTPRLHSGYINSLEQSLMDHSIELDLDEVTDRHTRTSLFKSGTLSKIRSIAAEYLLPTGTRETETATEIDPEADRLKALRGGDAVKIRGLLAQNPSPPRAWIPALIDLLAWDDMAASAARALAVVCDENVDLFVERFLDLTEDVTVRRRIPAILERAKDERAAEALVTALEDHHFEIRARSARVLSRRRAAGGGVPVAREAVQLRILSELRVEDRVWSGRRSYRDETDSPRIESAALAHIYALLSLILPQEPLEIARRGLRTQNPQLRGTALEYFESTLPEDILKALWPRLETDRALLGVKPKAPEKALQTLMQSVVLIDAALSELEPKPKSE